MVNFLNSARCHVSWTKLVMLGVKKYLDALNLDVLDEFCILVGSTFECSYIILYIYIYSNELCMGSRVAMVLGVFTRTMCHVKLTRNSSDGMKGSNPSSSGGHAVRAERGMPERMSDRKSEYTCHTSR